MWSFWLTYHLRLSNTLCYTRWSHWCLYSSNFCIQILIWSSHQYGSMPLKFWSIGLINAINVILVILMTQLIFCVQIIHYINPLCGWFSYWSKIVAVFCFSIGQHFIAGGLAGVMTTVIMAPGERVKCLMQVCSITVGITSDKMLADKNKWETIKRNMNK